jgi:uncharacterized membrane protein
MVIYHFCFDLRYFGLARWDFEHDIRWLAARTLILSSFLLIAGISAALARRDPAADARWPRHVAVIGGAALLVTACERDDVPALVHLVRRAARHRDYRCCSRGR